VAFLDAYCPAYLTGLGGKRASSRSPASVSRNTVKKWARLGYLRDAFRTDGGHVRIPRRQVERVARLEQLIAKAPESTDPVPEPVERSDLPWVVAKPPAVLVRAPSGAHRAPISWTFHRHSYPRTSSKPPPIRARLVGNPAIWPLQRRKSCRSPWRGCTAEWSPIRCRSPESAPDSVR
jgi:hypothetical protein